MALSKIDRINILEAARYRVLLEYAIEGLKAHEGTFMKPEYLANYLQSRLDAIDEEIKSIKQQ